MRLPLLFLVPLAIVVWALGSELTDTDTDTAQLQKAYATEQNEIDLALAELALEASSGITTQEQAQEKIDLWVRANAGRLKEQAERASELDVAAPLVEEQPDIAQDGPGSTAGSRIAELDGLQGERIQELRAQSSSAEHAQLLIDEWTNGTEGRAVFEERAAILATMSRDNPLGSQSIVLEVPEDATPVQLATLDIQERVARRIQDIRSRHPNADGEEMQRLLDESRADFESDFEQMRSLIDETRHAELVATVQRLRAEVSSEKAALIPAK